MNLKSQLNQEQCLRKQAYRRGYKLVKYRRDNRWYNQYGPYALTELPMGQIKRYGLTIEEVETILKGMALV